MKFLSVVLCIHWLFFSACEVLGMEAEDCALYDHESTTWKTMYRQLSTGVVPGSKPFTTKLSLSSLHSEGSCVIMIYKPYVAVSCTYLSSNFVYEWSPEIFKEQDTTDLWIHLGSLNDTKDTVSSDLTFIGRRGSIRNHLLFPSSGLQPPIRVKWQPMMNMDYYYNCVTGCLYTKKAETSPGTHSFFLRTGRNFTHLHISYNSSKHRPSHELTLNSSDITLDENWKNLTVVWNTQDGDIGVLVDGSPLRGLGKYSRLAKKSETIVAEISNGGGHLTLCDERFKKVADAGSNGEIVIATTLVPSASSQNLESYDASKNWLYVMALVCLAVLLLVAIVLLALLLRTKKELQREREASARDVIPVETFGGPRTAAARSTAPLYPAAHTHDPHAASASPKGSNDGSKTTAPAVPSSNTTPYSFNGTRTQQEC